MRARDLATLALRNLARNRRRTALSLAVVAAGAAALVLTAGFVRFSFDGLREAMIRGGLGHLEIADAADVAARPGALDRPPSAAFEGWRELRKELERSPAEGGRIPGVVAVGANLHLMGLIQTAGGKSASFVGVGVEPARERAMGFETRLRAGEELPLAERDAAEPDDVVLLARGLADSLAVGVGDAVTLVATTAEGTLNALDVRVAGIVTTGVAELDTRYVKLPLATAQRLAETERVSNLVVVLDDTAGTELALGAARAALAAAEPGLAVTPWTERAPFYDQVRDLYLGIFVFLGSIVFVLVVLAASNTLVMAVLERVREIGALRAIGTGRGQIAALFLAEAAWLGAIGAALGAALGAAAIATINALDLRMPPPPGAVDPIDLRLAVVPEAFVGAAALMIVVLLLAAVLPAARAARLSIVDSLGHL